MTKSNKCWWLVILMGCFGCDPSVLLPDPLDPRLPKFTTDGNNVAGGFSIIIAFGYREQSILFLEL
jgi:hypothetical protein